MRFLLGADKSIIPVSLAQESSNTKNHKEGLFFFLGGLFLFLVVLIIIFAIRKFIRPTRLGKCVKRKDSCKAAKKYFSGKLETIRYFSFRTLKEASNDFNESNLLGKGGFGPVYLGKLKDGRQVAIKKLSFEKSQQGEPEFLAEVRLITSIQHKNLVRLLGCCCEGPQRVLVYEYMKNRSLDLIIYGKNQYLKWNTRFHIILGIARGLQYLHEESHLRIVHRDIKASNILLDGNFQPRIGDFGLAKFFPEDQLYLSTTFAGTLGYTAPEYAIRGEFSEKADIYSFGVLVLEIISCRRNTDLKLPSERQYLPEYISEVNGWEPHDPMYHFGTSRAWKLYERSRMIELIDPRMQKDGFLVKDVMKTIHVALLCLQPHPNIRPAMSEIVAMLTWKVEMIKSPIKPTFLDHRRTNDEKVSWETMSDGFPSLETESPSLTQPPNSRDFDASGCSSIKSDGILIV